MMNYSNFALSPRIPSLVWLPYSATYLRNVAAWKIYSATYLRNVAAWLTYSATYLGNVAAWKIYSATYLGNVAAWLIYSATFPAYVTKWLTYSATFPAYVTKWLTYSTGIMGFISVKKAPSGNKITPFVVRIPLLAKNNTLYYSIQTKFNILSPNEKEFTKSKISIS
jgi:hypothetical protein